MHRSLLFFLLMLPLICTTGGRVFGDAGPLPVISGVSPQPFAAQAIRIADALEFLGRPLSPESRKALDQAIHQADDSLVASAIQQIFDPLTLAFVTINPEVISIPGDSPSRPAAC